MRSTDCSSAGDFGSALELRRDAVLAVDMLMNMGSATALRVVDRSAESKLLPTLGRRRLRTGESAGWWSGTGGGESQLARGVESAVESKALVAYVETLKREAGSLRCGDWIFTFLRASRRFFSMVEVESSFSILAV